MVVEVQMDYFILFSQALKSHGAIIFAKRCKKIYTSAE